MITRTSTPRRRSAFGRDPITSPRPPVLTNGAHSDVTKRTFSGAATGREPPWVAASRCVDPIVEMGEDVVRGLDVRQPWLTHLTRRQLVVETVEAQDVFVHPAGGVGDRRSGAHDERPIARLHEHEFARRLVERPGG